MLASGLSKLIIHGTLHSVFCGTNFERNYSQQNRDVRSGEAGEAVPHLKNCTKKIKSI